MSRTYNERSVPNGRGRAGEKKAKRRSQRRARHILEDCNEVKYRSKKETLDRETSQGDYGV